MLRGLILLLQFTGVPRLVKGLMLDRRVPLRLKLILPAALVYLILPFDLVPDILPVLGRIDDVLALLLSLVLFLGLAPKDVVLEHLGRPSGSTGRDSSKSDKNVIEGDYRVIKDDDESASA